MSRTIVYVDALNLYYRALRSTGYKWLNLEALATASLPVGCRIVGINYYYAPVSGRTDPDAPNRQNVYLRALRTLPLVSLYSGNFLAKRVWAGLCQPVEFRPVRWFALMYPKTTCCSGLEDRRKGLRREPWRSPSPGCLPKEV